MSNVNLTNTTFSGKQVEGMKQAFWTAAFTNPAINTLLAVVPGIKAKQQIIILGLLGLVGRKSGSNCAPTASTEKIPATEKFWDPEYIEDRFEECFKDLLKKFTAWGLKNGIEKADLTGTDFALFLESRISTALEESIWRIAFFSNKAIKNVASSGTLKDGVSVEYFNAINGFYAQLFVGVTAGKITRQAIPANAGASYSAQTFDAATTTGNGVTTMFSEMVRLADERLTSSANAGFIVTKSIADQYKRERLANDKIQMAYERVENGLDRLYYDGYPIYVLSVQDRIIKSYFDNGTKWDNPHRAIFTTIGENLQIGTEEESNLSALDAFYDKKDKTYIVDIGFNFDALVAEEHMVVVAY